MAGSGSAVMVGCGEVRQDTGRTPYFTEEECAELINDWFNLYPDVRTLAEKTCTLARQNGGVAVTHGGRERHLPALFLQGRGLPEEKLRMEAERQAFNHLIQGTAQEIMKAAMVRVHKAATAAFPLLQIYDELLLEAPRADAERVASRLEVLMSDSLQGVNLPAKATIAADWGSLK